MPSGGGFVCRCPVGYVGQRCETLVPPPTPQPTTTTKSTTAGSPGPFRCELASCGCAPYTMDWCGNVNMGSWCTASESNCRVCGGLVCAAPAAAAGGNTEGAAVQGGTLSVATVAAVAAGTVLTVLLAVLATVALRRRRARGPAASLPPIIDLWDDAGSCTLSSATTSTV